MANKAWPPEDKARMDAAAEEAHKGLAVIQEKYPEAMEEISTWLTNWRQTAGLKRLARLLLEGETAT